MPKDKSYAVYKQMTLTRANSLFANYAVAKIRIFFGGASRTIVALPFINTCIWQPMVVRTQPVVFFSSLATDHYS